MARFDFNKRQLKANTSPQGDPGEYCISVHAEVETPSQGNGLASTSR